jgi:putative ABC transport system permease protein
MINILGLAIGMTVCLIIMQYVTYENSYDKFHTNFNELYRVTFKIFKHNELIVDCAAAVPAVGPKLKEIYPEVLDYCRAFPVSGIMSYKEKSFREERMHVVDSTFIEMFSFPLLVGDSKTALMGANKAIITESASKRFFGNENPIGKIVHWDGDVEFEITGVCADVPDNSHIKFTFLFSYGTIRKFWGEDVDNAWGWYDYNTYVLLKKGTNPKQIDEKFNQWLAKEFEESFEKYYTRYEFPLQPIGSIHLYSDLLQESEPAENGDGLAVQFLSIIALFVLILAWVNYINLATSQALSRAKEVGIRKVSGASKKELIFQFLLESLFINLIALIFAFVFVELITPYFQELINPNLSIHLLLSSDIWIYSLLIFIIGAILSGLYPALILSSYKPATVLKGKLSHSKKGTFLRKSLVIFQFTISICLISGSLIVYQQMSYLKNKELGINIDDTFVIQGPAVFESDSLRATQIEYFKQEIQKLSNVSSFTASSNVPGVEIFWGQGSRSEDQELGEVMYLVGIDHNFISAFDLKLLAGTNFTPNLKQDQTEIIVNKSAVKRYGYSKPEDIIGRKVFVSEDTMVVKGVIEDFNQLSLKTNITPLAFPFIQHSNDFFSMKLTGDNYQSTIQSIHAIWEEAFPGNPYDYFFLDEHFNKQYKKDLQFSNVFTIFTVFAIFIACLGLYALTAFNTNQRTKEIGIRKVLGASVISIVKLLIKEYLKLVFIAFIIAIPLTIYVMDLWLVNFAYRIHIPGSIFILSGFIVSFIAFFTISFQTIKVANSNPVNALKYE